MKIHISSLFSAIIFLSFSSGVYGGTIVPYLNDADAVFSTNNSVANSPYSGLTLANGVTLAANITPDALDLGNSTQPVQVLEIGGTTSGAGLWILNGNITFITKSGAANGFPSSTDDTDGTTDGNIAYSFGGLTAGLSYDIWASLNTANSTLTVSLNNNLTQLTLTGVTSAWNWMGNNAGIDFGAGMDVAGRLGGLSNNNTAGIFYAGTSTAENAVGLDGIATEAQVFNEVVAVPEPSVTILGGLGMLMTMIFRRKRD